MVPGQRAALSSGCAQRRRLLIAGRFARRQGPATPQPSAAQAEFAALRRQVAELKAAAAKGGGAPSVEVPVGATDASSEESERLAKKRRMDELQPELQYLGEVQGPSC